MSFRETRIIYEQPFLRWGFSKCDRTPNVPSSFLKWRGRDVFLCIQFTWPIPLTQNKKRHSEHLKNTIDAHTLSISILHGNMRSWRYSSCFLKKKKKKPDGTNSGPIADCSLLRACSLSLGHDQITKPCHFFFTHTCKKECCYFFIQEVLTTLVDGDCKWIVNLINN